MLSFAAALVLLLVSVCCAALGEEAKFVTVQEWLDAKGECGECMLLLKILEEVNPVVAIAGDETGTVNLYSGGGEDLLFVFDPENHSNTGAWIVLANPKYNPYEGTIEMADWTILRLIPPDAL